MDEQLNEHLQPGETLRAAVWVSRVDGRTAVGMTRAEMSPFRMRFRRPEPDGPGARRGVNGAPKSLAVGLDQHIRIVTHPRLLALTDRRLLVLSRRRFFAKSADLRLLWECPREKLASSAERGGLLRLLFTDKSQVDLLTPAAGLQSFLDG